MSWAAVAVGAVSLGVGIYSKARSSSRVKKLEKIKQNYPVQGEYQDNVNLAASQRGMSDATLSFYKQQNERQLAAANKTALDIGGNVNDVNKNYAASLQGLSELSAKNALLERDDLKTLIEQKVALASQNTMKWAIGYKGWQDQISRARDQGVAADNNIAKGISSIGMGVSSKVGRGDGSQKRSSAKTGGDDFSRGVFNMDSNQMRQTGDFSSDSDNIHGEGMNYTPGQGW